MRSGLHGVDTWLDSLVLARYLLSNFCLSRLVIFWLNDDTYLFFLRFLLIFVRDEIHLVGDYDSRRVWGRFLGFVQSDMG